MRLAAGMEHRPFATPDAAIRAAFPLDDGGPLAARGIDYGHVSGGTSGPWQFAARIDRDARVKAIVRNAADTEAVFRVVVAYAHGASYRGMAKKLGISDRTVRRWHRAAWQQIGERLQAEGLLVVSTA